MNRSGERALLSVKQVADQGADVFGRDGDDVVEVHVARVIETVRCPDGDLRCEPTNCAGEGSDSHLA